MTGSSFFFLLNKRPNSFKELDRKGRPPGDESKVDRGVRLSVSAALDQACTMNGHWLWEVLTCPNTANWGHQKLILSSRGLDLEVQTQVLQGYAPPRALKEALSCLFQPWAVLVGLGVLRLGL